MFFFGPSRCNFKRTAKIEKKYTNTNANKILAQIFCLWYLCPCKSTYQLIELEMKNIISALICFVVLSTAATAQLTKPFSIVDVQDNVTIKLEGDKNTEITCVWTDANLHQPGVSVTYSVQFDTIGGDFSNPWSIIGSACCAPFFSDTTVKISYAYLIGELNKIYQTHYGKSFKPGESITLDWSVHVTAIKPGPTYEFASTSSRRITFVRGQFDDEYVPVQLLQPLDNSSFFVEDNNVVKLKFQWNKAYCPGGCGAPQYQIMFDSLGGDFSNPLYFFSVPQSPYDTLLDLRQDVLAQMMFDDGMPTNTPKTYKWTVNVFGNGEEFNADAWKISLQRGLMKTEHIPFVTDAPIDNAVFKLEKNKTDSIVFSWHHTRTGYPDAATYEILFSPATQLNFNAPLFRLKANGNDTTYIARFLTLRDSLDKKYGQNWTSLALKWTVEADIIGYKFLSEDTNDILFARGFFTGINTVGKQAQSINLYPNPASSELTVLVAEELQAIAVLDVTGRKVFDKTVDGFANSTGAYTVDIAALANGVYFISAQNKNGLSLPPCRFIKQ
jgi:hypothetical protein